MSTTLRKATLFALRKAGLKRLRSVSGLGQPYICCLGDFIGENPYYNRDSGRPERVLMASWCMQFKHPMVIDAGGKLGFIATHLAALLHDRAATIHTFELVPFTFECLSYAVRRLRLESRVYPVNCALSSSPSLVHMNYSPSNTMLARVGDSGGATDHRKLSAWAAALTVDEVAQALGGSVQLVKINVEGHEENVLRGAARVHSGSTAPAVCIELNPDALARSGSSVPRLAGLLSRYRCFYVNDWIGQRLPYGDPVMDIAHVDWECNTLLYPISKNRSSVGATRLAPPALDSRGYAPPTGARPSRLTVWHSPVRFRA